MFLALIEAAGVGPLEPVIDVGGGASRLLDCRLDRGFRHVTVLDLAEGALRASRKRLGARQDQVEWLVADITDWQPPPGRYALWHDRAVFHFVVEEAERQAYVRALRGGLAPGGHTVFATFAPTGPERCSGLPVQRNSADSLAAALGKGFELRDGRTEAHPTPSGRIQEFQ